MFSNIIGRAYGAVAKAVGSSKGRDQGNLLPDSIRLTLTSGKSDWKGETEAQRPHIS